MFDNKLLGVDSSDAALWYASRTIEEVMKRQAKLIVCDAVRAFFTVVTGVVLGFALGLSVVRIFTWIS
jgi:hypothetical protein